MDYCLADAAYTKAVTLYRRSESEAGALQSFARASGEVIAAIPPLHDGASALMRVGRIFTSRLWKKRRTWRTKWHVSIHSICWPRGS